MSRAVDRHWDIFLSHASQDEALAREIASNLASRGQHVWIDSHELQPGRVLLRRIEEGIRDSWYFIPLVTRDYLDRTNESWVAKELELALATHSQDDELIPIWWGVNAKDIAAARWELQNILGVRSQDPWHAAMAVYQAMFPGAEVTFATPEEVSTSVRLDCPSSDPRPRSRLLKGAASVVVDDVLILSREQCLQSSAAPILRELLVNAIAHRDYEDPRAIVVEVRPGRISLSSPGLPLEQIGVEGLLDCQGVALRNPSIARLLRDRGLMELGATGIKRVCQQLRDSDLPPPVVENVDGSLRVRIALDGHA